MAVVEAAEAVVDLVAAVVQVAEEVAQEVGKRDPPEASVVGISRGSFRGGILVDKSSLR